MAKIESGVIFDFDGVLVDTGEYHKQSWHDLAKNEGLQFSDEYFYSTFGMQNYQILPKMAGRELSNDEINRLSEWKESRFRDLIADGIKPMDGVKELLLDLKSTGFKLAVGSSAPRVNLDFMLGGASLSGMFDAEVSGEDVKNGKPAPDTFLKAARRIGVEPERCVVIEDAIAGVLAGKSAGMKVVAITTSTKREKLLAAKADRVIERFAEVDAVFFEDLIKGITV